ncbi:MAG TPA: GspMb/PilO family protein [Vicinamibacterales bacterium]|jgi:Tfp pilus assembly protein PilO
MNLTLARRIFQEKRSTVLPLAIALVANLAVYVFVVYPLQAHVAGAEAQRVASERSLQAAGTADAAARAILAGKERADQELKIFYQQVLPADLSGARRLTYARLAELAQQSSLRYRSRTFEPEDIRDSQLHRLRITMVLEGDYANVRRFVYALETTPEFLILDNVALAQGNQPGSPLLLTIEVSTYYRAVHGS